MKIVSDWISVGVHTTDSNIPTSLHNPMKIDYVYEFYAGDVNSQGKTLPPEVFTLPAGTTVVYPRYLAMLMAKELAKKYVYSKCENKKTWAGHRPDGEWLTVADEITGDPGFKQEAVIKKSTGVVMQEQVSALNEERKEIESKIDYSQLSFEDLKAVAKKKGLTIFHKTKQQLIDDLNANKEAV